MATQTSAADRHRARPMLHAMQAIANLALRTKLILAFLIVTILSVGALSLLTNRVLQTAMTNEAGERLHTLASSRGQAVGDLLSQEADRLHVFALNKALQDSVELANTEYTVDSAAIPAQLLLLDKQWIAATSDAEPLIQARLTSVAASELREYIDAFPNNVELFVTDRYGATVGATNRTTDFYQADEAWWQAAYNDGRGAMFIDQPEYDHSSKTLAVDIAVPVYSHGNPELVGILRTTYRMQALTELLATQSFGHTGQANLLLSDGRMFMPDGTIDVVPPDTLAQLHAPTASTYLEVMRERKQRIISTAPVASTNLSAASAIKNLNWVMVVDQSASEALQSLNQTISVTVNTGLGALIGAGLLALLIAQAISAPIGQLTKTAQQIAAGDLSARLRLAQHDEIGMLAQNFNTMADSLEARITTEQQARAEALRLQQVEAKNRQVLEQTVAELHESIAMRDHLSVTVRELSSPVLPVLHGVLVMPLIGVIDSERATAILESLLQAIQRHRAHILIIDVTGLPIIDTHVARMLLQTADAAKLLGAQTMLVGIQPELAQTIIGLGLSLSNLITRADLQGGVAYAILHGHGTKN